MIATVERTDMPIPPLDQEIDGFLPAEEWVWITCDWEKLSPRAGSKPLRAEVNASLTIAEAMRMPNPFTATDRELYPFVVPNVRAWNCKARNLETGEIEDVPSPLDGGAEVFKVVKFETIFWLAYVLKTMHFQGGPDRPKETSESAPMSEPGSEDA